MEFQCPLCGKVGVVEVFQPRLVVDVEELDLAFNNVKPKDRYFVFD